MTVIICFALTTQLPAQIGGLSASKLTVTNATTLPTGTFDFEPAFSVYHCANIFLPDGSMNSLNGSQYSSSMFIRITAGLAEKFEAGAIFSPSLEQISTGMKYTVFGAEKVSIAMISGATLPAGNRFISDSLIDNEHHATLSLGSVATYAVNDKASFDVVFSFTRIIGEHPFHSVLSYGVGSGYFFSENFQGILEVTGFSNLGDGVYSSKLSVVPGFTYTISSKLLLVLGWQADLIGKNENAGFGYFGAFTIPL